MVVVPGAWCLVSLEPPLMIIIIIWSPPNDNSSHVTFCYKLPLANCNAIAYSYTIPSGDDLLGGGWVHLLRALFA